MSIGKLVDYACYNSSLPRYVEYVHSRGIPVDVAKHWGVGYFDGCVELCGYSEDDLDAQDFVCWSRVHGVDGKRVEDSLCLPLVSFDGECHGFQVRALGHKRFVVICESFFDAMSLYTAGIRCVISVQGASVTSWFGKFISLVASTVIVAFDNDSAGDAGFSKIQKYTGPSCSVYRFMPRGSDFNDDLVYNGGASIGNRFKEMFCG